MSTETKKKDDYGTSATVGTPNVSFLIKTHLSRSKKALRQPIDIDAPFALMRNPFTGDFSFYVDNRDIMPKEELKRIYPFAHSEWLAENFNTYFNESAEGKTDEELQQHTFAYPLGDASPGIVLYRESPDKVVIKPKSTENSVVRVSAEDLGKSIGALVRKTIATLQVDFGNSERVKNLRTKLSEFQL